jgi:hypothetical protein
MAAHAVLRNRSPISLGIAVAENSLASANLTGNSPDFGPWPTPHVSQASDFSSESEHSGENSLDIASGNNRELREIFWINDVFRLQYSCKPYM